MDFDHIVIGSGLAALGAALGASEKQRVLVIGNPLVGRFLFYDERGTVPCAFTGAGGLGNDWHGVIPMALRNNFGGASSEGFTKLLSYFYSGIDFEKRIHLPSLFVPWRAIRPQREFPRLALRRPQLTIVNESVNRIRVLGQKVEVSTDAQSFYGAKVWVAAGTLHTPGLLERSFDKKFARGLVSDHCFSYIGQASDLPAPRLTHTRKGIFFPAAYTEKAEALYTLRPARFAFRQLDYGIEQRAVFGLPTGNAVAKIAKRASPGLLTEAFFNRFGLFPSSPMHSVYAQVLVRDAYDFGSEERLVRARPVTIRAATDLARQHQPFGAITQSRLLDAFIPGIHLHHSIDRESLHAVEIDCPGSPIQIVDASTAQNIGPDHHSFKMMLAAHDRVAASLA
jgi:hypothetical protein